MKETPQNKTVRENMRPGKLSLPGFLGDDSRDLALLMEEDNVVIERLGVTHAAVAARMRALREAGVAGLGEFTAVAAHFEVRVDSVRGRIPCPFGDRGLCAKTSVTVRNLAIGREITFTDLHMHLIEAHGFYEGRGSAYRLEPEVLVAVLEVERAVT